MVCSYRQVHACMPFSNLGFNVSNYKLNNQGNKACTPRTRVITIKFSSPQKKVFQDASVHVRYSSVLVSEFRVSVFCSITSCTIYILQSKHL